MMVQGGRRRDDAVSSWSEEVGKNKVEGIMNEETWKTKKGTEAHEAKILLCTKEWGGSWLSWEHTQWVRKEKESDRSRRLQRIIAH